MKDGLITLADVPELGSEHKPTSQIVVARLDDKLYDPRYGRFEISQSDADGWTRNLSDTFGGRVAIDFDHSSDRGQGTKAAAWITGLHQQGKTITADVEWTPAGAKAVRDGEYKYISPTFLPNYVDEHKESHGRALIGAALTNRPVLRKGMPLLSLSRDEFPELALDPEQERERARELHREISADEPLTLTAAIDAAFTLGVSADERKLALKEGNSLPDGSYPIRNTAQLHAAAILAASGHGDAAAAKKLIARRAKELGVPLGELPGMGQAKKQAARDSRRPVDLKALAQKLDLPEDTDEATLLAKVDELKTLATPSPGDAGKEETAEPTTLAEPGSDGTITLSADQVAELITNANLGAAAAKQLSEQTFAHAWQKALSEGRAAPSQEETVKALFDQSPELAIKTLDSFVPIVPVTPRGSGEGQAAGPAPLGMDDERFALHTEAKQLAAQKTAANPSLDPGEAYILAAQEIEDRKFTGQDAF